jgi:glycosyltransferase involved in cell wall biosynthesis
VTRTETPAQEDQSHLDFSIVVPTFNRPDSLVRCLDAITRLEYPTTGFEVIIVDDGSKMPLDGAVSPFIGALQIRLLRRENAGPACARNSGIRAAKGRYVALTDDDCAPSADWLDQLADRFRKDSECGVVGTAVNGLVENPYSEASQILIDFLLEYFNYRQGTCGFGTSNNMAFPRQTLLEMGGFDESFPLSAAEDRELLDRWNAHGHALVYSPDVTVVHYHEMNFAGFSRQHRNYGRGAHRYHRRRVKAGRGRLTTEPLSFYLEMMRFPFRSGKNWSQSLGVMLLIIWSQIVNVWGYCHEALVRQFHRDNPVP